jgi:argininosuccinate lyase
MIESATFDPGRMARAADAETTAATDLAEWLVARGTPFRDAHAAVGELVRRHLDVGTPLRELVASDSRLGSEAAALVAPGVAVTRRTSPGGGGPAPLERQLAAYRAMLAAEDVAVG